MECDLIDAGAGPVLLFVPGSYSSHAAWKGVQAALGGSYRMVSISLPGYGRTPEIRDMDRHDIGIITDFVAGIIDRIGAPVHLVGQSWGGAGQPVAGGAGGGPFPDFDASRAVRSDRRWSYAELGGALAARVAHMPADLAVGLLP